MTMSANATASASSVTITIKATAQATAAYTADFGAGTVRINGQLQATGWKDEATFVVTGWNNQTSSLAEFYSSAATRVARILPNGSIASNSALTSFEGNSAQTGIGFVNGPSKAGLQAGLPYDTTWYRDTAGIWATGGGVRLGNNSGTIAAGGRMFSGSGAPGSIIGSASGDFYFQTDTPTVTNQRLYVNNGGTWVGIL